MLYKQIFLETTTTQDNYDEAIKAVNYCFTGEVISEKLLKIFECEKCVNLSKQVY